MGWASYLEDIVNRLVSDLRELRSNLDQRGWSPGFEAEAASLLRRAEQLTSEILRNWNYATDPTLDLAHELVKARREVAEARADLQRARERLREIEAHVETINAALAETKAKLREVQDEKRRLESKLRDAVDADPGRIYDLYPPRPNSTAKVRKPRP